MENQINEKSVGISRQGLRTWGLLLLAAGIAGSSLVQNGMLDNLSGNALLEALEDPTTMMAATAAIILQVLEACAVPFFTFLLVEGFCHTSNFKNYLLRVLGVAVLSEVPYNLAVGGTWLVMDSRNPVFGMVLCLVMLYLFRYYSGKTFSRIAIKGVVLSAAVVWANILGIEHGPCCVIVAAALWATWKKPMFRTLAGCTAAVCCLMVSMFYLGAPMAFLVIHSYNGEKGESNRWVNYLSYPVLLLGFGIAAKFL